MKRVFYTSLILVVTLGFASASCLSNKAVDGKNIIDASAESNSGKSATRRPTIEDPKEKLVDIIAQNNIRKSDLKIFIDKSDYYLAVKHSDSVLIKYPCVFGFNAVDDKAREGDGCTPEGDFGIRSMYAHKSWKYFIWIDYPNAESWRRFKKRKADGDIPSDATIGGEVGIHGVPEGMDDMIDNGTNWTLGCISLKNAHITDLYKSINQNVKIKIVP